MTISKLEEYLIEKEKRERKSIGHKIQEYMQRLI